MKLPQLSLRELFLLVALVAMGCGWWAHSRQYGKIRHELRRDALRLVILERTLKHDGYIVDWLRDDDGYLERESGGPTYALEPQTDDEYRLAHELRYEAVP